MIKVIIQAAKQESLQKAEGESIYKCFPTFQVGYHVGKPIESLNRKWLISGGTKNRT